MSNPFQEMTQDLQNRIRELAYLMWESAGRQHGMATEYWLKAEAEVMSALQAAASRMMPVPPPAKSTPAKASKNAEDPAAPAPAGIATAAPASPSGEAAAKAPARRTSTRSKTKE